MLNLVTRILNGVNFASYEYNNLVYKAQEIPHRQIISIDNVAVNTIVSLDLSDVLDHAFLVHSVDMDINTTEENLTGNVATDKSNITSFLTLVIKDKITNNVVKRHIFQVDSTPNDFVNGLILLPTYKYEIKSDKPLTSLKLVGEPVHMLPTINKNLLTFNLN